MHLRAPSVDKGVSAFLWALFFFLYVFFGSVAVGVAKGQALIFAALAHLWRSLGELTQRGTRR